MSASVSLPMSPAATVAILRAALRSVVHEERYRAVRGGLMLADIVDVPEARYRALLDYEREAAARGYPALA